jgi:superfamily I DNA/RNA helicase
VLFRTNAQVRAIALSLRAAGLPARVRADLDLFAHAAVRDLVAYLRLAYSPNDGPALARVVNVPPRRLRAIEQALRKHPVPIAELPHWAQKRGGPTARRIVEDFLAMLQELHLNASERQPIDVLEIVLQRTGYREWLQGQKDGQTRLVQVEELRTAMRNTQAPDLATWLADMHLGEVDTSATDSHAVVLTTIHASKGAEWPVVFLVGFEEGLLPHLRPASADRLKRGEKDERRLAYVAFSRTQVLRYLVYCLNRRIPSADEMGRLEPRRPSRFLVALPKDLIERVDQAQVT